jgi:hypothetical protein
VFEHTCTNTYFFLNQIPRNRDDEFDTSILRYATEDEEAKLFANIIDFKAGRCFMKTKFHNVFSNVIDRIYKKCRNLWNYVTGLQGLGKTSTVLYYVLNCRRKKDKGIHYIDLNEIVKRDKYLENFTSFSENFQAGDCLVIDHVTVFISHYTDKIRRTLEDKDIKFILIPTGFTASLRNGEIDCGKELQLDEECFQKIWSGSIKAMDCEDEDLARKGKDVYDVFSKHFIMTPRLLHTVLEFMYVFGKTVEQAWFQYTKEIQEEIAEFMGSENNAVCDRFMLHTAVLLQYVPDEGEYIFTEAQGKQIMKALNIFHVDLHRVTQEDMEDNSRVIELGMQEGDIAVKVHHLQPYLARDWRERLPYNLEKVLQSAESDEIFTIMFQNGGARKEFVKLLVHAQELKGIILLPLICHTMETSYQPSETQFCVSQRKTDDWLLLRIPSKRFFHPNQPSIDDFRRNVPSSLKGYEKIVYMVASYIKKLAVSTDKFVVYPEIPNLLGFDYCVFVPMKDEMEACSPAKISRPSSVLYLVQVTTGDSYRGDVIGRALDVVKSVFSDMAITISVVIIIAKGETLVYPLTKCKFENITILNLHEKTSSLLQELLQSNSLLHNFYLQFVRKKQE